MAHTRAMLPLIGALRTERRRQKISQAALAAKIGWASHTIANAELGISSPTMAFVVDYAAGLGVELRLVRSDGGVMDVGPVRRTVMCGGPCGRAFPVTRTGLLRKHRCVAVS